MANFNISVDAKVKKSPIQEQLSEMKGLKVDVRFNPQTLSRKAFNTHLDSFKNLYVDVKVRKKTLQDSIKDVGLPLKITTVDVTKTAIQNGINKATEGVKAGLSIKINNPIVDIGAIQKQLSNTKFTLKIDTGTNVTTKVAKELEKNSNSKSNDSAESETNYKRRIKVLNQEFNKIKSLYNRASTFSKGHATTSNFNQTLESMKSQVGIAEGLRKEIQQFYDIDTDTFSTTKKANGKDLAQTYKEYANSLKGIPKFAKEGADSIDGMTQKQRESIKVTKTINTVFRQLDKAQQVFDKANKLNRTGKDEGSLKETLNNNKELMGELQQLRTQFENTYQDFETGMYPSELYNSKDVENLVDKAQTYTKASKELKNNIHQIQNDALNEQGTAKIQNQLLATQKLIDKAQGIMSDSGQSLKWYNPEVYNRLQSIIDKTQRANAEGKGLKPEELRAFSKEVIAADTSVKELDKNVNSVGNRLKTLFKNRFQSLISSFGIIYFIQLLKQVEENVVKIDSSLAQLSLVTGTTGQGLTDMFGNAAKSAQELGTSITDILSSTETFARLGYSADDSAKLARVTGMMANVGDMSTDEATTGMTSILKAYGISVDDAEKVGDVLTTVGKKYAISTSELAEGLENSGSALEAANNSFEQSVAILAAGNASVQDASKAANAIKTTTMRVRGATADLEDMGEEVDELAKSTPKMRKEIEALSGVDIMADEDTFKSTYQILLEIAKVWDKLSDTSQANLLEDLAGKRNANVIKSIITNIKDMSGAYKDAQESAGNLVKDNDKVMDTAEKQLARVSATFEEFSKSGLSANVVKGFASVIETVVNALTKLNGGLGSLGTVISVLGLVSLISYFVKLKSNVAATTTVVGGFIEFVRQVRVASEAGATGLSALSKGFNSLGNGATKANAVIAIIGLIAMAISGIISLIDAHNQKQQEAIEKVKELKTQYQETTTSVAKSKSDIKSAKDSGLEQEFERLKKGVSSTGENLTLTNDQYERYKDICEEIVGYCPELKDGYDSATEALSSQNNVLEKANKLLEKKQRLEAKNLTTNDNLETAYKDAKDTYDEADEARKKVRLNNNQIELPLTNSMYRYEYDNLTKTKVTYDSKHSTTPENLGSDLTKILGVNKAYEKYIKQGETMQSAFNDSIINNAEKVQNKLKDIYVNGGNFKADGLTYSIDSGNALIKEAISNLDTYKEKLDTTNQSIKEAEDGYKDTLQTVAQATTQWYDLGNDSQNLIDKWIENNSNFDVSKLDTEEKRKKAQDTVRKMVQKIADSSDTQDEISKLLKLDTSKLNAKDYAKQAESLINSISKSTGIDKKTIKLGLDLDETSVKRVNNQIKEVKNQLSDSKSGDVQKYLDSLSADDFDKVMEVIHSKSGETITSLKELKQALADLDNQTTLKNIPDLEDIDKSIDDIQTAFSTAKKVIQEYNSNGQISMDNLQSLLSLDGKYINLLVDKNGKLNLNTEAYKQLIKAEMEEQKASLIKSTADNINNISSKAQAQQILADNTAALADKEYDLADAYLVEALASAKAKSIKSGDDSIYKAALSEVDLLSKKLSLVDSTYQGMIKNIDYGLTGDTTNLDTESTRLGKLADQYQKKKDDLDDIKDKYQENIDAIQDNVDVLDDEIDNLEKEKDALNDKKDALEEQKSDLEDAKSSIKDMVDITEEYVKQTLQDEIDSYDKQIDKLEEKKQKFDDIIDKQKESLEQEKDAYEWRKTIQEKNNALSEAQAKANAYAFDNSSEGKANLKSAQADLKSAKDDRDDELYNHMIDTRSDNLDKLKDKSDNRYDKQKDELEKQKGAIQKQADNEVYIRKRVYKLIDGYSNSTYKKLSQYAKKHTDKTSAEFNHMWNKAKSANRKYNKQGLVTGALLNSFDRKIYSLENRINGVNNKIKKVDTSIDGLKDKQTALNKKTQVWKNKQDAITKQQDAYDKKIDSIKDKQEQLNDTLSNTVSSTSSIADNAKTYYRYTKKAKDLYGKQKGYKVSFNGRTFTTTEMNEDRAATALTKRISKTFANEGIYVDRDYIKKKMKTLKYASGTKSSKGNLVIKDEEGYEFTLANTSQGTYANVPENSIIFDKKSTDNLWNFAKQPNSFFEDKFKEYMSSGKLQEFANNSQFIDKLSNISVPQTIVQSPQQSIQNDNRINMPITIEGNADKNTIKSMQDEMYKAMIQVNRNRRK